MSTATPTAGDGQTCCQPTVAGDPLPEAVAAALARLYAALGDPVRLRLLSLIATSGELCSCDLVEPLAKAQPTVSHHTKVLAEAGIIIGERRGRWVYWRVNPDQADFIRHALSSETAQAASTLADH